MTRPGICLVAIVALSIQVCCQFSNPNAVCLTANDAGSPPGSLIQIPLMIGGHVDVEFSVNTSFTIDGFDFFVVMTSGTIGGYPGASLHPVTGGVFGPPLASGTTSSPGGGRLDDSRDPEHHARRECDLRDSHAAARQQLGRVADWR